MKKQKSVLEYACRHGVIDRLLEEYITVCHNGEDAEDKKKASKGRSRFPNVAGFCGYFGIGESEYDELSQKYPDKFGKIKAIFEDEALNSEISPALLSAYLKKRFGYGRETESRERSLNIVFEHDIFGDGE